MRILRLTNSDDLNPAVPEALRTPAVVEGIVAGATGEPVETIVRIIWPRPALPGIIDSWILRYEPDFVLFVVSSFWFTYESVPLKIERTFGRLGRPIASAGSRAGAFRPFAQSQVFHAGRRLALRTIGGATHFSAAEVLSNAEACARRILAHEDVGMVIRGPHAAFTSDAGAAARRRSQRRWFDVHHGLEQLCGQLHIEYVSFERPTSNAGDRGRFQGDLVHVTEQGHRERAEAESRALLAAWRKARGLT